MTPTSPTPTATAGIEEPVDAPLVEHRFDAMGTWCHVLVVDGERALLEEAEAEVRRLEAAWTRFDPDSEVNRLNARAGEPVAVSDDTFRLVLRAEEAFRRTNGWFDPFLARDIAAAGYDRDFADLTAAPGEVPVAPPPSAPPTPRARREPPVAIDGRRRTVTLAPGAAIDAGGIGKGLAADLVVATVRRHGAAGALVNLGGDLATWGQAPGQAWVVELEDPLDPGAPPVATIRLGDGGLCTSTPLRRRWRTAGGQDAHHLLDPGTGRPAPVALAAVTVIAPSACVAESLTKALFLAGPEIGADLLRHHDAGAVVIGLDRTVHRL